MLTHYFTDGEFHFVPNDDKVHKHAHKSWKAGPGDVSTTFWNFFLILNNFTFSVNIEFAVWIFYWKKK